MSPHTTEKRRSTHRDIGVGWSKASCIKRRYREIHLYTSVPGEEISTHLSRVLVTNESKLQARLKEKIRLKWLGIEAEFPANAKTSRLLGSAACFRPVPNLSHRHQAKLHPGVGSDGPPSALFLYVDSLFFSFSKEPLSPDVTSAR